MLLLRNSSAIMMFVVAKGEAFSVNWLKKKFNFSDKLLSQHRADAKPFHAKKAPQKQNIIQ